MIFFVEDLSVLPIIELNATTVLNDADQAPAGRDFGDCVSQPQDAMPGDIVSATFISGHLR
jgi:hypothetical protein